MGNSSVKGYRILDVKPNSPFDNKVEPYFDFIIDLITQPSPRQILDKLSGPSQRQPLANMMLKVKQNINKTIKFKIFSNKTEQLREVQVTPNNEWGDKQDLLGIQFRLEDPKLVRQNYCRIAEVQIGSPAARAGLVNDQYLIACEEIKYASVHQLVDSLHQILYSQDVQNKAVHFITYNVFTNKVSSHKIELVRKWGGKGVIGCEFLEGHLYKLPNNLEQIWKRYKEKSNHQTEIRIMQRQLLNSDGVSKRLAENLKKKAVKKDLMFKQPESFKQYEAEKLNNKSNGISKISIKNNEEPIKQINHEQINQIITKYQNKFSYLQQRLETLQNFIEQLLTQQKQQQHEAIQAVHLHPEPQTQLEKTSKVEFVAVPDNL